MSKKLPSPILKIKEQWKNKLPFVLFAMPDTSKCILHYQDDATLHTTDTFTEAGFVFAPFNYTGEAVLIPATSENTMEHEITYQLLESDKTKLVENSDEKVHHIQLVSTILSRINSRSVMKVVGSRKKELELHDIDLELIASRLFQLYPGAFRYMWYHPDTGLWCGASPEILVKSQGQMFATMALAGTKKAINGTLPEWSYKEIHEQQIVTDSIVTDLQKVTAVLKTSKPVTVRAGSLYHLQTEITGVIKTSRSTLSKVIKAIHPTPAVCGSPTNNARKVIYELEAYDREFYTGFLGPIDTAEDKATLFVNLRCAKIENKKACIYVGGGIVAGSVPDDEWEETENKLDTMKNVFASLIKY